MSPPVDDFPCNQFVEVITDYLEGAMPASEALRLESHLAECPGCASVLEQFRIVIRMSRRLSESDVDAVAPSRRDPVMTAFRRWAATRQ